MRSTGRITRLLRWPELNFLPGALKTSSASRTTVAKILAAVADNVVGGKLALFRREREKPSSSTNQQPSKAPTVQVDEKKPISKKRTCAALPEGRIMLETTTENH